MVVYLRKIIKFFRKTIKTGTSWEQRFFYKCLPVLYAKYHLKKKQTKKAFSLIKPNFRDFILLLQGLYCRFSDN